MEEYTNVKKLVFEVLDDDLFTEIDERIKDKFNINKNGLILISNKKAKIEYQHWFSGRKSKYSRQLNIKIRYNNDLTELQIAKFLEKLKKFLLGKERNFVLLIDEASEYYRNTSFDKLQKIEVDLRSLIYKAFIRYKGTLWDKNIIPMIKSLNIRNFDQIKNKPDFMLQELEFGTLINLFFDDLIKFDYSSLPSEAELRTKSIDELVKIIKSTKPISINEMYFEKYSLSLDDFLIIKEYRNKVMHFKEINYNDYSQFNSASTRQLNKLETIIKDLEGNTLEEMFNILSKIDFSAIVETIRNSLSALTNATTNALKSNDDIFNK